MRDTRIACVLLSAESFARPETTSKVQQIRNNTEFEQQRCGSSDQLETTEGSEMEQLKNESMQNDLKVQIHAAA